MNLGTFRQLTTAYPDSIELLVAIVDDDREETSHDHLIHQITVATTLSPTTVPQPASLTLHVHYR